VKTTAKHFEIFKKEIEKWRDVFGLKNWEFFVKHEVGEVGDTGTIAWTTADIDAKFVVVCLNKNCDNIDIPLTTDTIKEAAFHEILEAFFFKLRYLAKYRYIREEEIGEEIHNLIHVLEGVIYHKN